MSSQQDFNCIFCKETFDNKEDLQIHFRKHGDPTFNKNQKGKGRPPNEAQTSVEKKSDDVEMVSCDVCTEMFPTISKAITHKHKVHPDHDAKYFCPWCGKLFTMKHLFNKHLQSNHMNVERSDNTNFHCDTCDVDFYVPSAMLYHNKFFHRQDTDLPAIGQSKKLRMYQQEVIQIYYCAFCGDEYDNKVNLFKHMTDDHSDENQSPEEVLRCPSCEAIFYHLDAYEVHLTFHSKDDLYSEKNTIFDEIEEFSLETVPPITEKVENFEPDVESAMNAVGIDKFLEMAMDETSDKNIDGVPSKSKKHKKHKKKKKEAITLDEFLNMNKDVFGEGLDFQGIEEVPTQVVAKRLKQNKMNKPPTAGLKMAQSTELEKLKKHGIVVKMKPTRKPPVPGLRVGNKIINKQMPVVTKPSINSQSTPDEVLSKLINQSNSQIKIVKKTSQNSPKSDQQNRQDIPDDTLSDQRGASPENIEVECDVNMPTEYTSSDNEGKEEKCGTDGLKTVNSNMNQECNKDLSNPHVSEKDAVVIKQDSIIKNENDSLNENDKEHNESLSKDIKEPIDTLRNCTNTTMKPVMQVTTPSNETFADKIESEEESTDDIENNHEFEEIKNPENSNKSLNALKHLSHLITVKSVIPLKSSAPTSPIQLGCEMKATKSQDDTSDNDEEKTDMREEILEPALTKDKSVHSIKNLSKNITIKPVAHSPTHSEKSNDDDYNDNEPIHRSKEISQQPVLVTKDKPSNSFNLMKNLRKNITVKPVTLSPKHTEMAHEGDEEDKDENHIEDTKSVETPSAGISNAVKLGIPVKNMCNQIPSTKSQNVLKTAKPTNLPEDKSEKQSNINLLRHLTNVTAKPVNVKRNIQQIPSKQKIMNQIAAQSSKKQEVNESIEIFSIDDSDDEPENDTSAQSIKNIISKPNLHETKSLNSIDTLKNISKHVTVKSVNQQVTSTNIVSAKRNNQENMTHAKNLCSMSNFSDDDDDDDNDHPNTPVASRINCITQKLKMQNNNLKSGILKNLGKHITVKSGNPSPTSSIKFNKDQSPGNNVEINEEPDSDDSYSGRVKITEITDDNDMSDNDNVANSVRDTDCDENVNVKSPESNSDHESFDKAEDDQEDDELSDLEGQIKANTLPKSDPSVSKVINFKNLNKNLTVKSLADKGEGNKDDESNIRNKIPNINSALSIKPFKQAKSENNSGDETFINKKIMNAAQVKRSIINQNQSMKQNIASGSKHNTVNKEVTVKTFQTKTVIQEITTTVTKTIKTVNQMVKQEVQSTSQNNVTKFQKIAGMKSSNQQVKNFQGVTVRHASPLAGTKIRGGAPPSFGNNIRPNPGNQLVPVRPARNTARMSSPRMPAVQRHGAPGAGQPRPPIVRPIKISPQVLSSAKRSAEEPVGHFSCFKKPKESLIPGSDIPSFANEAGSDSTVQFSASQMSKSNFTTSTKTIKGNTIVTQMKSEVSSSCQQLEKLNNVTGLKVMKTSQSRQATKVEEKCEMSPSKRNTLEAIEKLQKQGLLVKKPRRDDAAPPAPRSDEEDYMTEEPDD